MNFYAFNIGDYAGATRHLSWDEDMAYRRMLDAYYSREAPLPLDRRQVYRLVAASEQRQREAVDTVLEEFFEEREDGWHNNRADEEIAKTTIKKEKARANAMLSVAARQASKGSERFDHRSPETQEFVQHPLSERSANADNISANAGEQGNGRSAPNPNPNPNSNGYGGVVARARDPDADLEHRLRDAAGWQSEPAPMLAVTGEIQALLDNGADLDLDVIPVIRALAPQAGAKSWRYFTKAIARARDGRIEAATIVSPPSDNRRPTHAATQQKPSRDETFAAIDRRIDELERQQADSRAIAAGD
jgi:uncharacterized protein YdaU (DUF1376 family)